MSQAKKKCRQYNSDYLKYGFIESPVNKTLPMCLICEKVFSNEAMKPSRLIDHLNKIHKDKKDKDLNYFRKLKENFIKQPRLAKLFSSSVQQDNDGLLASYNISLMIAKSGKPHTIGEELIIPAVSEVIRTVLHKPASDIIKKIPLSNVTVQRRIDEMAQDVEDSLCGYLRTSRFSIQLDESTLPGNEALLLAYVRFAKEEQIYQELLFAKYLESDTKGESIFHALDEFFKEKEIPLHNILSVATDGAPAMVGRYRGFLAYLKKEVPNAITVHCIIHRQHLVAKNLSTRLHNSLHHVIKAINTIKSSFNDRLFKQLCIENNEDYNRLLRHTEVRWLSKGASLERFYKLFDSVLEFLEEENDSLRSNLIQSKSDIAYLTDLFKKFNEVNLQLQGDELNLIKSKTVIAAFVRKLLMYKQNFARGEFSQFENLSAIHKNDEDIDSYCQHLDVLHADFKQRFKDILNLEIPSWVFDPYSNFNEEQDISIQEQLIELTSNDELNSKFKQGYQHYWIQNQIRLQYPALWAIVEKFLIAFPSTYLVERGFSVVMNLITKKRNRIQINNRGDLRLLLTKIEPNIPKLVAAHQIHPSH